MENKITKVQKRDGRIVDFDFDRVVSAIFKAITATGQGDEVKAQKIADDVLKLFKRRFKNNGIPGVEQIQDIIEEVLIMEGLVDTAKSYILYREQRRRIREAAVASDEAVERVDQYLEKMDWEVQENANMAFSLQGLNHYAVSYIVKKYWLNKIYPKEIREANESGDFHLHNLDTLAPYCSGWDLYDFLRRGFGGTAGKLESKPPKHFRTVLGQIVNFIYTLAGEVAGAVSFSNFDTLVAPFIYYDNLNYHQVKQAMQEFLFNMATPTRVGFQCLSQDTQILTLDGWKAYDEISEGDEIRTFNIKTRELENKKVKSIFKRDYKGIMYNLKNRVQDQLISPNHRVLRKNFNSDNYVLEPVEDVLKLKSQIIIPIAGKNPNSKVNISDEQIKLMAWIIGEGSVERPGKHRCCYRVSIYQSKIKNRENYDEITGLLKHFNYEYTNHPATSLGDEVQQIRMNAENSRNIHEWFGTRENVHFIPYYLLNMSERQSRLFLDTYLKGDGKEGCKLLTSDLGILNDLQHIIVNAGYGFTTRVQKPVKGAVGRKNIYILRIIYHPETYITKIEKVDYDGVIWCPSTDNGTLVARRNGKVFITGNCPFSNVTLDLTPSPSFAKQPAVIGGLPQDKTYGEFQEEMNMLNRAFYEVMLEGDRNQRVFTFPIPTVSITKNFDWDNPALEPMWEATAKYGVNYFTNYVNSDMSPEDVRSMCCRLRLDLTELHNRGGGGLFGSGALTGSIGVVTINMPRLGYLSKTKKEFFQRLGHLMDLAKESLELKRKVIEDYIEKGLYPYSRHYLSNIKKSRGTYYGNHFSTIGLVGMNEMLVNFLGENIASKKGRVFAVEVMNFMRQRMVDYQKETGSIYNLEATPGESTVYRLCLKDKAKYPDIAAAGTKKSPYYTNSSQLPVNFTDDVFEALKLQDDIQCQYNGGTVQHLFLGERLSDTQSVKALVKKVFEKFRLPYITVTPTFSICPTHGYIAGEHFKCPKCAIEQPCEVYTRVVGYLRPVAQFNAGKQQEYKDRKEYRVKKETPAN